MRNVRVRRRRLIDLRRVQIGDYIVLAASILTFASLFMPWAVSSIQGAHDQWAFTYSEVASVVVIVLFLVTIFLVFYPAIAPETSLPPLPFSTPVVFLTIGAILLLFFDYQLGKYACISCQYVSRGFGVWVALVSSVVYLVGAVIKFGSRPVQSRRSAQGLSTQRQ